MIEVTSRRMECTLLTSNYSQMPAVALQPDPRPQAVRYFFLMLKQRIVGARLTCVIYRKQIFNGVLLHINCMSSRNEASSPLCYIFLHLTHRSFHCKKLKFIVSLFCLNITGTQRLFISNVTDRIMFKHNDNQPFPMPPKPFPLLILY